MLSESDCDNSKSGLGVSASVVAPAPIFDTRVLTVPAGVEERGASPRPRLPLESGAASNLSSLWGCRPVGLRCPVAQQAALALKAASTTRLPNPRVQTRRWGARLCVSRAPLALHPPVLGTRAARENPAAVASSPRREKLSNETVL